jgi:linoleoyl-CoA desaturase
MVWNIYGKQYDLTKYMDKHPGGKEILLKCENEKDLTVLFETYHAFSDKENIKKMLNKFEIKKEVTSTDNQEFSNGVGYVKQYDFTNYDKLLQEIKFQFPNRISTKANFLWTLQNALIFIAYVYFFYSAMLSTYYSTIIKCIFACFAGCTYISLGFSVMHDASHYGVSIYSNINEFVSKIWNGWGLWNANIWFYHHVLNHHSFTGESLLDPDLYHLQPFANKEIQSSFSHKKQKLHNATEYIPYVLILFPGQYFGQIINYLFTLKKPKIFRIGIPNKIMYESLDVFLMCCKIYCLYYGLWLPTFFYMITLNFVYYINIIFDHDTYETAIENHYEGNDWLKLQICNSGNFLNENMIWTRFFGAINYQIEHHLFPNVSNIHYPTIAPIVKKFCDENNIPYVNHPTLWGAYQSFMKMLKKQNS